MTAFKGLGTYGNAAGVVTPLDHKLSNAGMVTKATATTIRSGLFWPGTATIVSGKANMSYDVAAFTGVTQRSAAAGAVFGGNDGTLNLATDVTGAALVAPGSNSRYHLVFWWHREYSIDGTDSNPVIGVLQGTAAASPTVPSLASYPGAVELARILVPAGVTATNSGTTITQTAPFTAAAGGIVPVRNTTERDAGTWLESQRVWDIATDITWAYTGSTWYPVGANVPTVMLSRNGTAYDLPNSAYTVLAGTYLTTTKQLDATTSSGTITIVTPGVYLIEASASFSANATGARQLVVNKNSTTVTTNPLMYAGVPGSSVTNGTVAATKRVVLVANDVLRLHLYQNSGGVLTMPTASDQAVGTFFNVSYVGAT